MRDLFFKIFEMSHFDTGISVTAFSIPHFVYLALIFGALFLLYFKFKNAPLERKQNLLNLLIILLTVSYLSDFFFHDFVYADVENGVVLESGGLNMDKLPFHICTALCPISAFVQFNGKFKRFIEPVAILATLAPMMYLVYPASIGDGEPWCYQAMQTMFYHGVLMIWGILNISFGVVKPEIRNSYKAGILLVGITLWAKLGNLLLEHNWFFLEEDAFYIGLVEGGIIPKWLLMVINPIVFFIAVLGVYGVYYGVMKIKNNKKAAVEEKEPALV